MKQLFLLISVFSLTFSIPYPQHVSATTNLPDGMLQEIGDEEIISIVTEYYDFDSEGTTTVTRRAMPTSDFKLTIVTTRINEKKGDNFKFVACGKWLVNPFFEFTDCIGLSWSDNFTLYDSYAYSYTKNYSNGIPLYDYSACTLNDVIPEAGVAYDVDLQLGQRDDEIYLVAKTYSYPNSTGTANVVASYGHVVITASGIDVSISSAKEIGMSVGFASSIEKASPAYAAFNY